jgi:diaminopimelate decarboxylase
MAEELLQYRNAKLFWNDVDVQKQTAKLSTPAYVYSKDLLSKRFQEFQKAFPKGRLHFAMKANHHEALLQHLQSLGSHVDVVSIGEAEKAMQCGFRADQILFSGPGKTQKEINQALEWGLFQINVESVDEILKIKKTGKLARIGLRWTPGLDVKTHPFIKTSHTDTKFGLSFEEIDQLIPEILKDPHLKLQGFSLHLGSQILDLIDFDQAFQSYLEMVAGFQKKYPSLDLKTLDIGGGLGLDYQTSDISTDSARLVEYKKIVDRHFSNSPFQILFEPGRFLVARSGGILTEVQVVKKTKNKKIVVLDAGMNNLMRPILYQAHHGVFPLNIRNAELEKMDLVGPLCESSDFIALDRPMPELQVGDRLWVADCGAYASSMKSDYNLRPDAEEVFIEDLNL